MWPVGHMFDMTGVTYVKETVFELQTCNAIAIT